MDNVTKLIILRGNSGSGKTATGKALQKKIPLEETLNRHKQKPNANEFGEKEMKSWWNEKDLLNIIPEVYLYKELCLRIIKY